MSPREEADIEVLKGENDKAFVEIDGEILEIENNYEWVSYTIQPGDSLSQIALNTTGDANRYWDIANYNGISNPNFIYVGQQILVPGNSSTGTTVGVTTGNNNNWQPYTVQPGDSLWAIAQRTTGDGNRYWDIANYNDIDNPNAIYVGQQILVPGNSSTGTTVGVTTVNNPEPTGGSSEPNYSNQVEFTQGFAEPHPLQVDMFPGSQLVMQDFPDSYQITLDRVDGYGYIQNNLETWIVIHGWNNSAADSSQLAAAIERNDNSNQVLTLDWSGMAGTGEDSYLDLHDAAVWIEEVAEAVVEQLNKWGFDRNKINLAGHSLGAYVAYEISEQLGGINNLVALDPALSTEGGYSIDEVDFSSYSRWSWSLESSWLGNDNIARTADESFRVDFGLANFVKAHGAVKDVWRYMLDNPRGAISQYFGLEDMNQYGKGKPWSMSLDAAGFGSDWEATIDVRDRYFGSGNWVPDTLRETGRIGIFSDFNIKEVHVAS
ncbi:MAG: alpha/beta fold hydrolase [Okeania sp. SIO2F4]|uniref:alpha/beta fold hydrolase n=1 Tax=Okeania sp. SIO2F4 TaxID=2607790 RepID=UPI00142A9838|nr:alpha/beta fold hydrolase [Okeania sp. SIO2F4]NES08230.1 alpha/beta fold hydrolase [Okeania sp. SIO2F4]